MRLLLILLPVVFAFLRQRTNRYVFSALTSLSCAAIAMMRAPVMAAALAISALGDFFLANRKDRESWYLLGILGFFAGHAVFIVHALGRVAHPQAGLIAGGVLGAVFIPYLVLRVIRRVPKLLRIPVVAYTLISLAGLACAVMMGNIVYIAAIAMLLFSDTMIAECDFVGNKAVGFLILPTYYASHILAALSALI